MKKYIIYRKQVCEILDEQDGMYTLRPISDDSITMKVPVNCNVLRNLITKKDIDKLLKEAKNIDVIDNYDKMIEQEYKNLLSTGELADIIKVIKTTYLRNEYRKNNNKKLSDKDVMYFEKAEKYLYEEFSVVLGKSYADTKKYVIETIEAFNE